MDLSSTRKQGIWPQISSSAFLELRWSRSSGHEAAEGKSWRRFLKGRSETGQLRKALKFDCDGDKDMGAGVERDMLSEGKYGRISRFECRTC